LASTVIRTSTGQSASESSWRIGVMNGQLGSRSLSSVPRPSLIVTRPAQRYSPVIRR
jgi:hypothetical protein